MAVIIIWVMKSFRFLPDWMANSVIGFGIVLESRNAMAQRPLGVDVSSYQGGGINWASVKSDGVSFAWAKATEGTIAAGYHVDGDFTVNENNGKAAGVYMGAYHFAHPAVDTPAAEATFFWSTAGSYILADGKSLMPMLDMEVFSGVDGASSYSTWANDWCADIVSDAASSGVSIKPAIYVSACNACEFNSSVSQWGSDIADYNGENVYTGTPWSTCTSCEVWGSGVWNFWQVSSTGAISGISGDVDLDGFNGTSATLVSTMIATSASSPVYYWDPQGTSGANPYTGSMTGTWETSKWSTGSGGQASTTSWVDGKAACFGVHTGLGTPAFTVTMNSSHVVAGIFDGNFAPNSCAVTITGSGVITLADGPQGIYAYNASDGSLASITINNVIAGSGQVVAEGAGQIYLNGVNTYSGGTQLGFSATQAFNGIVNFNNSSSFGPGVITLTTNGNGGALVAEGTSAITIPNNFTLANSTTNNFVGTVAGVTYSGNWSLGANLLNFETGNTAGKIDNISGVVSGSAGLMVSDAGTLILSGVNTYTGNTTIISPCVLTIGGAGQLNSGAYANNIVNGGTFTYASSASQTLSGVISGAGAFKMTGPGTLTLTRANTYTGNTTITGGTLALGAGGSIGASVVNVSNGGTLANVTTTTRTIGGATTFSAGGLASFTATGGSSTVVGKISVTGNLSLTGYGVIINVSGASLAVGTYRLMDCTGTLTGSASSIPTITGTALGAGLIASVVTTGGAAGHVDLVVAKSTPTFANLTAGQSTTYGSTSVTLGGTVRAPGPMYPPSGETITVTINGNAQTTTINDSTGDFSINYNSSAIPAIGTAYTITYSYAGDASFNSAGDASTTLMVNRAALSISANNDSKTYGQTKTYGAGSTAFTSTPLQNGETILTVTITASGGTAATNTVGPYNLMPSGATGGTFNAANYNIIYNNGTLTVNPLPVNLTGTRAYDGTNDADGGDIVIGKCGWQRCGDRDVGQCHVGKLECGPRGDHLGGELGVGRRGGDELHADRSNRFGDDYVRSVLNHFREH